MQTPVRLAHLLGVTDVNIHAVGTAVDLRRAQLHQFEKALVEPELAHRLVQVDHGADGLLRCLVVVDSLGHGELLLDECALAHFDGSTGSRDLSLTKTTRNLVGLVLLALRDTV